MGERFVRGSESEVITAKEDDHLMPLSGMTCGTSETRRASCQPRIGVDW